jgi:hypothetical protein
LPVVGLVVFVVGADDVLLVVDCGLAILHLSLIFRELIANIDEFRFFVPFVLVDGIPSIQNFRFARVNFPSLPIYLPVKFPFKNRSVTRELVLLTTEIVCCGDPLEVVCPPKLLIKYLSPFPNGSVGKYSLIATTMEIKLNFVPRFNLKGYAVPFLNVSGKVEGEKSVSLQIVEKGPYAILIWANEDELVLSLSLVVTLNVRSEFAVSHVALNFTEGVTVLLRLTDGPPICLHE